MNNRKRNDLSQYNTFASLCNFYKVDFRTFKNWIEPVQYLIPSRKEADSKAKLSRTEIHSIISYLGKPFPGKNDSRDY